MEKQERKEKKILTENRLVTVNRRETSFEGMVTQFENNEDNVYSFIKEDKNMIFYPKLSITKQDIATMPFLAQLREEITTWEKKLEQARNKDALIIKKALIEMRKEQYIIKDSYNRPLALSQIPIFSKFPLKLEDTSYVDKNNNIEIHGVSLMNKKVISTILCNYSKLKQDSYDSFNGDTWYLMQSFDELCDEALEPYPIYVDIVKYKIDNLSNLQIQQKIEEQFDVKYSLEYISSLWRNKIPKLIAQKAQEQYIIWYYKKYNKPMKKCSRCGQEKPAHSLFFSKNNTSKDNFYSICKKCRNNKNKKNEVKK